MSSVLLLLRRTPSSTLNVSQLRVEMVEHYAGTSVLAETYATFNSLHLSANDFHRNVHESRSTLCSPFSSGATNYCNTAGRCRDFARCSIARNDALSRSAPPCWGNSRTTRRKIPENQNKKELFNVLGMKIFRVADSYFAWKRTLVLSVLFD